MEYLSDAPSLLTKAKFDIPILDLSLPDGQDMDTFITLRGRFPEIPMVVVTGLSDEETGTQAVRLDAQDYLIKESFGKDLLVRSICYTIERHSLRTRIFRLIEDLSDYSLPSHSTFWLNK